MLPHLLRRFALAVAVATLAVAAVSVTAGLVRLLPWVTAASVPIGVVLVVARMLLLASLEVALLVAAPVGVAIEVWRLNVDHSIRTLLACGMPPRRIAAHAAGAALLVACCLAATSGCWHAHMADPGGSANQMLRAGRDVCRAGQPHNVPVLGLTWICLDGRARAVSVFGSPDAPVVWSAADLRFSSDLSAALLADVQVTTKTPRLRVTVDRATASGFAPGVRPGSGAASTRALVFAVAVLVSSVLCAWVLVRNPVRSQLAAFGVGVAGPAAFLLLADHLLALPWTGALCATSLASMAPWAACKVLRVRWLSRPRAGAT